MKEHLLWGLGFLCLLGCQNRQAEQVVHKQADQVEHIENISLLTPTPGSLKVNYKSILAISDFLYGVRGEHTAEKHRRGHHDREKLARAKSEIQRGDHGQEKLARAKSEIQRGHHGQEKLARAKGNVLTRSFELCFIITNY